jgi:hypothetical protein
VAYKAVREQNHQSLQSKVAKYLPPECVSNSSVPQTNTVSKLSWRTLDHKSDSTEWESERTLRKRKSTTTDAKNFKDYLGDDKLPFERAAHSSPPVLVAPSSSKDHGDSDSDIRHSNPTPEPHERLCMSGSEYSMSLHIDGPRSPDLATPKSISDSSEISSVTCSLSPRSRTSFQVPSLLRSGDQKQSPSPLTERMQRTPLPIRKESNSTSNPVETKQDMELKSQQTPIVHRPTQAESAGSSQQYSTDLPVDTNLKRKSLDSRRVSSDSIYADSPQMKILSIGGNYSGHQSPSAASSCGIVGTGTSSHSGPRSPASIVLSPDDLGTLPRKRATLGADRMQESITRGAPSGSYTVFSSNLTALSSESADWGQDAGSKIVKRRGRKASNITTAGRRQLNDNTPATRLPDQISLVNSPKQDNKINGPPRQLPSLDHTPRTAFPILDAAQPYAKTPLANQLTNIPPQFHHTLPPRPSITPPPGSSPQLLQKYRPPAVVFTIDNRAESRMPTADVQSFIEQFTKNARVITPSIQPSAAHCVYPIGIIMWQSLPNFYKWYKETTGSTEIGPLRFELINDQRRTEKVFVVPEGNLNYFRTLKQYVWDLFWVASNLNNGPSLFQVSISPFLSHGANLSSQQSTWNSVNSTSSLPRTSAVTSLENIMVVAEPQTLLAATSSPRPADRSPPLSNSTGRTSNIEHILNIKEVKEVKGGASRRSTAPTTNQPAGNSSIGASSCSNRVPRPSEYIHGPPGPPVNANRTLWDKTMLRYRANSLVRRPNPAPNCSERY